MVRTKKAGFLTKLVILALLIYMATSLLNLQGQLRTARMQQETLSTQVAAQKQENADLADAVENNDDPERIQEIAREKLGLVAPGEKVFVITN
ncbi:MAG: cell division protein FtsL [Clostridia bacterium]|nr:cell division protein FtsL [Clostridia bacterium]